jgi:molybdenum cofactor guanylyltransferase
MSDVTIAVLAGGQSSRMGRNKSFILLDGKPIIQHVLDRVRQLNYPTILITNTPDQYAEFDLPLAGDVLPGSGSLVGLHAALYHSPSAHTLCVACDMPLLNVNLLRYLIDLRHEADIVVPLVAGRPENLHAVYSRDCLPMMAHQIADDNLKVNRLHTKLNVRYVDESGLRVYDPHLHSFFNINTPEDVARLCDGSN